jgi:transcriptional regulator with XRE-family HTH domain
METPKTRPDTFHVYTPSSLGAAIRHYREQAGLSQAELAALTGIHRSYLSELEGGHETEHLKRLLRVLKQLNARMTLEKLNDDG